jgi:hypothetical protein
MYAVSDLAMHMDDVDVFIPPLDNSDSSDARPPAYAHASPRLYAHASGPPRLIAASATKVDSYVLWCAIHA